MVESIHPTAAKLMDTVSTMLDSDNPHDILVDEVLRISGVSRGSLYHHFADFPGLIHATLPHYEARDEGHICLNLRVDYKTI